MLMISPVSFLHIIHQMNYLSSNNQGFTHYADWYTVAMYIWIMISKIIIFKFFYICVLRRHVTSISSHILNICKNCCYFVIVSYWWWNWILTTQACDTDNTINTISKKWKELLNFCDSNYINQWDKGKMGD